MSHVAYCPLRHIALARLASSLPLVRNHRLLSLMFGVALAWTVLLVEAFDCSCPSASAVSDKGFFVETVVDYIDVVSVAIVVDVLALRMVVAVSGMSRNYLCLAYCDDYQTCYPCCTCSAGCIVDHHIVVAGSSVVDSAVIDFPFSTSPVLAPVVVLSAGGVLPGCNTAALVGIVDCSLDIVCVHLGCCCTCRHGGIVGYIGLSGSS